MRRIDLLSALETFVCAVEEGSLSQAARRLAKTPSAVTKAIAGLEATLGVQLLERTTRRLALTESGRLYLATATDVLRRLADGARQLSERDDEPRGLLRVTAAHSFGHAILAPLCAPFAQAFPRVRIELSLSDHYVDIVGEGFDLALRMGNYDLPSQIVKPIGSNRGLLCASPGYLARRGRPTAPADLAQHDCVIYRHPTLANTWTFERGGVRARLEPKGPLVTDDYGLALAAALDGAGVLPCPQWSVVDALEAGRLVPLLV
ncbi:LysR family transcriptional regulator, partial [Burkholderia mallei]